MKLSFGSLEMYTVRCFDKTEIKAEGVELYRGADKSLAQPGRKQATATEDFDVHISYL
jgi:hypothetical protein